MNVSVLAIGFIGLLIFFAAIKFIIRLPFYIMTFGILGALGYAVYKFVLPMLGM